MNFGLGSESISWRIGYHMVRLSKRYPWLFTMGMRLRDGKSADNVFSGQTEIVIEGFPRSGNTFASYAFRLAQNRPARIAHHCHHEAPVSLAVKRNIPVIVVVRRPIDACVSLAVHRGKSAIDVEPVRWLEFYRNIARLKSGLVIAKFDDITSNFGSIVDEVNQRWGARFTPFVHSDENVKQVMNHIRQDSMRSLADNVRERKIAIPSVDRDALKDPLHEQVNTEPDLVALFAEADQVYEDLVARR